MDVIPYQVILKILREFYILEFNMTDKNLIIYKGYYGYFKWDITRKIHFLFPNIKNMYGKCLSNTIDDELTFQRLKQIKYYDSLSDDIYLNDNYSFPNIEVLSTLVVRDLFLYKNFFTSAFINTIKSLVILIDSSFGLSIFNELKKLEILKIFPRNYYDLEDEGRLPFTLMRGDLCSESVRELVVDGITEITFKHLPNLEYLKYGLDLNPRAVTIKDYQIYNLCKYSVKLKELEIGYNIPNGSNITTDVRYNNMTYLEKCKINLDSYSEGSDIFNINKLSVLMLKKCKQLYFQYTYSNRDVTYIGNFIAMKLKYLYIKCPTKNIKFIHLPVLKYLGVEYFSKKSDIQLYVKNINLIKKCKLLKYLYIRCEYFEFLKIANKILNDTNIRYKISSCYLVNSEHLRYGNFSYKKIIKFNRKMKKIFGLDIK